MSKGGSIGNAATLTGCPQHGVVKCTNCSAPSYTLNSEKGVCEANVCTCKNGDAAVGQACTSQGANLCSKCVDGYELKAAACKPKPCLKGSSVSFGFANETGKATSTAHTLSGAAASVSLSLIHI